MKPLLLVDVDGVLNSFGSDTELEHVFWANGFTMEVPLGTSNRIFTLSKHFDFMWATTWEDDAPRILAPELGFGFEWPVLKFTQGKMSQPTWKLPTVREFVKENEGKKIAWIDDDIWEDAQRLVELVNTVRKTNDLFFLPINPTTGLTDEDVDKLIEWAVQHGG